MATRKTKADPEAGKAMEIFSPQVAIAQAKGALKKFRGDLTKALADRIPVEMFESVCLTTVRRADDKLLKAIHTSPGSLVGSCLQAAHLGLLPEGILGEAYLVPVWSKRHRGHVVDLRIGYPGLMKIARRDGEILDIQPEVVHQNDEFEVRLGTTREIVHVPWYCRGQDEPGEIIAAYATAEIRGSEQVAFQVVPRRDLDKAASMSGNPKDPSSMSDAWRGNFEAMAQKTAARRLCKWLPLPDSARQAINRDERAELGIIDVAAEEKQVSDHKAATLDDLVDMGGEYDQSPPEEPEDQSQDPSVPPDDQPPDDAGVPSNKGAT